MSAVLTIKKEVVEFRQSDLIYVKPVKGKGRGVFAIRDIPADTLLERVPLIMLPGKHIVDGVYNEWLINCAFEWDDDYMALPLGYGPMYNHAWEPNADYDFGKRSMFYYTIRAIKKDEEITINYNGDFEDLTNPGFKVL